MRTYYLDINKFIRSEYWEDNNIKSFILKEKVYRDRVLRQEYEKVKFKQKTAELNAEIKNFQAKTEQVEAMAADVTKQINDLNVKMEAAQSPDDTIK